MKAQLFFLGLLITSLFFGACEKPVEIQEVEVCSEKEKAESLVAFFHPFVQTVYILPGSLEEIMDALNLIPIPSSPGYYEYNGFTLSGNTVTLPVAIEEVDLDAMHEIATLAESQMDEIYAVENSDELIASSKTRRGYRCERVDIARTTRCHVFPNYSSNSKHFDRYLCQKSFSSDYCTEYQGTIGYHYTYYNQDCAGSPDETRKIVATTCD